MAILDFADLHFWEKKEISKRGSSLTLFIYSDDESGFDCIKPLGLRQERTI